MHDARETWTTPHLEVLPLSATANQTTGTPSDGVFAMTTLS